MNMEHHEIEMILDDDEYKDYEVINREEVDCAGVRWSSRDSIYVEGL